MYEFQRPHNFPAIQCTIVRRINEQRKKQKETARFSAACPSNGLPSPPVDHDDMFKQREDAPAALPATPLLELSGTGTPSSGISCAGSPRESQDGMDEKAIRDKIQELQNEKHQLFQLMKNLLSKQQQQQQQQMTIKSEQQQQQQTAIKPEQQQQQQQQQAEEQRQPHAIEAPSSKPPPHSNVGSSNSSSCSERSPSPQTPPIQERMLSTIQPSSCSASSSSSSQHIRSTSMDHRPLPPPPPPRYMPYHRRPPPLAPPRYYGRYGGGRGPVAGFSPPSYPPRRGPLPYSPSRAPSSPALRATSYRPSRSLSDRHIPRY